MDNFGECGQIILLNVLHDLQEGREGREEGGRAEGGGEREREEN